MGREKRKREILAKYRAGEKVSGLKPPSFSQPTPIGEKAKLPEATTGPGPRKVFSLGEETKKVPDFAAVTESAKQRTKESILKKYGVSTFTPGGGGDMTSTGSADRTKEAILKKYGVESTPTPKSWSPSTLTTGGRKPVSASSYQSLFPKGKAPEGPDIPQTLPSTPYASKQGETKTASLPYAAGLQTKAVPEYHRLNPAESGLEKWGLEEKVLKARMAQRERYRTEPSTENQGSGEGAFQRYVQLPTPEERLQEYVSVMAQSDFEEKSKYRNTYDKEREEFNYIAGIYTDTGFDDILYDHINGNEIARHRISLAPGVRAYEDIPQEAVQLFNYIYATQGPEKAYDFMDLIAQEQYTGIEALALGAIDKLGVPSASAAVGGGLSALTGNEAAAKENRDWYAQMKRDMAAAQNQHPVAYGVGEVGGTIGLMASIASGVGAIPGFAALPNIAQTALSGSAAWGGTAAIQGLGDAATGQKKWGEYGLDVLTNAAAGGAGGAAGAAAGAAGAKVLKALNLQGNTLAQAVAAGLSGVGGVAGRESVYQGGRYAQDPENYQLDKQQLMKETLAAFAFSAFGYLTRNYVGKDQATVQQDTDNALAEKYFKGMTPEEARAEYHRLAKLYHPDHHPGDPVAEELMKEVNAAYASFENACGAQASQTMAAAQSSGDTAAWERARGEFDRSVLALMDLAEESGLIKDRLAREALEILQNVSLSAGPLGLDTESGGRYDEQREIQTGGLTDGGEAAGLDAGREARDSRDGGEILWRGAGAGHAGDRSVWEKASGFVERTTSEGKIVRKTGKQGHYAYRVTSPESYAPATQEAMKADREWGLGATVVDSFERNDGQRTFRGMEATTGPEGQVFLVNGCGKEVVAHEGLHSGLRRNILEAQRFLELTQEIEITTDKIAFVLEKIGIAYYDEGGREFDFEHLKEETAAFLSGMIESGRAGKVFGLTEENSPELYTAWRQMKQAMGANPMLRSGEGPGGEGESRFLLGEIEGLVSKSPDSQPSLISDQALNELMSDQSFLNFLKRKGDLKLTKDMTRDRKRTAIREAVERIAQKKSASPVEADHANIDVDMEGHTPQQRQIIKDYQQSTDQSILSFVERWRTLKDPNYKKKIRMSIGDVSQQTVQDIKALLGLDVSGYTHALSGNALEHIEARHGTNGKADQSMSDPADIARMRYVLENYDSVEPLFETDGTVKTSREQRNADGSHAPLLQFQKRIDGTYYVVEAVPDSSARQMRIVSAYIKKADGSTGQEPSMPQSGQRPTSKTPLDASTSIKPIIPQTSIGVKDAEATDLGGQLLDLDPVTQMELKDLALDMLEKEKGNISPDGEISISESEIGDIFRRAVKGFTAGGKVVGFTGLPQEHQTSFLTGLDSADPEVRSVLMQVYDRVDYAMKQDTDRSYYRRGIGQNIIYLGKKATASTIAHELFHWIDKDRQISQSLLSGLTQDFIALNVASGGDIKEYLIERYPEAFRKNEWGQIIMRPQYRGIADIFNGFSDGEVYYGYGHKAEYWKRQGVLEAEAWAQFGRILFDNDPKVLKMFADIFPNLLRDATIMTKGGN